MDNEIDLKEIFLVLWRGKYLILGITAAFLAAAFVYIFFVATPMYQYSALLDMTSYQVKGKAMLMLIEQDEVVNEAMEGMSEDSEGSLESVKVDILPDNEYVLQIGAKHPDRQLCVSAVKEAGLAIVEAVSGYRFKQMSLDRERSERLLIYLDGIAEEYLSSRDKRIDELLEEDPVYKRLLEEKAANLVKLKMLDFNMEELTGQPMLDTDLWLNGQSDLARPVPMSKRLYLAAAVLFGLMISIFVLFAKHYYVTQANRLDE